ncbi:kynurenine 3-monooxygenase [Nitzschia inconspicua]|uniref:Kynurenine 3-monooxygenase n=1 Tax=Nitzschia inconspicua TaxID=303405 RepID=A0A9K3P7Y4_9STRA|nr:kynurenine 3-monooxygenase [Nitzschia inconspicua]KAG7367857.1 kynurenine 3-monooxygenase [Nitzschia inconspicua]
MCRVTSQTQTDENAQTTTGIRNVVIAGAGPAGLLLTALLMQRNQELPEPLYNIILVDGRDDLSQFSMEELKKSFRSWMLGLAGHGCSALRTCHGLYEEYCKKVGIELTSLSIHIGSKEFTQSATPEEMKDTDNENFIIDRNFIVAAIARFVDDAKKQPHNNNLCQTLYQHKLMYVDYDQRRVLVRSVIDANNEFYLPYDLLVGCDGVRSVVREAMVKRHSTFEMDVGDIFQAFKAVHVERPDTVKEASLHLLPACFPDMLGIALPETGNMLNISMGVPRHLFDQLAPDLKSDDPKVVAEYTRKNFQAFQLEDYDDFAQQWVDQPWNRTGQVHCNFYHSNEINVVLMGDAAHATSPSIGMGMNTALRDAAVFYNLLQQHKDDFSIVLPSFSQLRVKEGNSLTDLAMNLYCMDTKQQMVETIHMVVRTTLHKMIPNIIAEHPQNMIGRVKFNLSDVYQQATTLGIMQKHRRINDTIRHEYFEESTGMITKRRNGLRRWNNPLSLSNSIIVVLLLVLFQPFFKSLLVEAATDQTLNYQRYAVYPPYCADPTEMATRTIPPLEAITENGDDAPTTKLVHVTAVIRHGARTPTHPKECWSGYWDEPDGVWDCNVKTMLSSRPYTSPSAGESLLLVEKVYDAFRGESADSIYKNQLNGTCQEAQLIEQGVQQQISNGMALRDAYIYDGSNDNQDSRLRLFDTTEKGMYPFQEPVLRYRSDDDQRTLASGQILLTTMFEQELNSYRTAEGRNPVIPHHTADRHVDILSPKAGCPTHKEAERQALGSKEYQDFIQSDESKNVLRLLKEGVGIANPTGSLVDCLMTAICTDRSLPPALDDFGKEEQDDVWTKEYGSHRFQRVVDYMIQNHTIINRYNDGQWSKVVMAPMWAEIMDYMMPSLLPDDNNDRVKFALYSGHDSTLAPLMASLSPRLWNATSFPWYASMMIIEIHERRSHDPSSVRPEFFFRLIYNGETLTWLVDGCPEFAHLCDVSVLTDRVLSFATRKNGGCGSNEDGDDTVPSSADDDDDVAIRFQERLNETLVNHPIMVIVVSMITSFVVGSLLTFCLVMWCRRRQPLRKQRDQSDLVQDSDMNTSDMEEPDIVID